MTLKVLGKIRLSDVNIVTPIIIVVFNLALIPRYGAIGAAVATAAGFITQNLSGSWHCGLGAAALAFSKSSMSRFSWCLVPALLVFT